MEVLSLTYSFSKVTNNVIERCMMRFVAVSVLIFKLVGTSNEADNDGRQRSSDT